MTKETFIYGLNACAVTYHNGQKLYEHDDLVKCFENLELFKQDPKAVKVLKMRDTTPEERELIDKYIKSISKPTVVNFWDLEKEPCDDMVDVAIDQLKELGYSFSYSIDNIFAEIEKFTRLQREYEEQTLAEIITKYDFIVGSKECKCKLMEVLPEGANIVYSPYIASPTMIYAIKKFDITDWIKE